VAPRRRGRHCESGAAVRAHRAGGNVGADAVAKSPPDGYTVVMGALSTHAVNPSLYPSMPYDAVRDFAPLSLVAT
jgi:tripartite-type tricarboxylate transporter receptor subunit TctC